jgi:hypothetical protein
VLRTSAYGAALRMPGAREIPRVLPRLSAKIQQGMELHKKL